MAEALGIRATISDFDANNLTPELEKYVNDEDGIEGNPTEYLRYLQPLSLMINI